MKIRHLLFVLCLPLVTSLASSQPVWAQTTEQVAVEQAQVAPTKKPTLETVEIEILDHDAQATLSATQEASTESKLASPSAEVVQKIQEKKDEDITETGGKQKSKLVTYIEEHPPGPLSWNNFLLHALIKAIEKGLPANIVVLLLLFPLIASLIAVSRHILGLQGFGIYIPAVLSVAFVSTGIFNGVIIFLAVLIFATLTRFLIKKLKLPYLPRTAMLLWGVSILVLGLLVLSSQFNILDLLSINIFPILIIMLLTENFMESQLFNSQKEALKLTFETLLIAVSCAVLISQDAVQMFVILRPELTLIGTAVLNYMIGKYTGLRLLEYLRFSQIINNK